jgi:DNA-binding FadR family transcriptional regulator
LTILAHSAVLSRMPDVRRSIARQSVTDIISEKLEGLIVSGVLNVGDELPSERDLAAALAVSRETVRGSIRRLAERGIVEVSHGSRTRVVSTDVGPLQIGISQPSTINRYDADAVHQARMLVERAVVAEAAVAIDAAALDLLDASLAAQRQALRDPLQFLICDREFHVTIYRAAPNALLADFVTDLYTYMLDERRQAVSRPGAIGKSYEDHVAIVAALRARDAEAVVAAFTRHLTRIYVTSRSIRAALEAPEPRSAARKQSASTGARTRRNLAAVRGSEGRK